MPSMNEDIERYPVFMVNSNGKLKQIRIESTDDYNHYEFELHHFIPKSIRKNNTELYERIVHLQKLILLPKDVHHSIHAGKGYRGLENWELLFNRKQWRSGVYENRTGNDTLGSVYVKAAWGHNQDN